MSWKISEKGNIVMTKGDTPAFTVNLTTQDERGNLYDYEFQDGDEVIFAVRREKEDGRFLFSIPMDKETHQIIFTEGDTKHLPVGNYIYEVSLNNGSYHCTFIENRILKLTTEIY